mmetsp:Transcript_11059/g.16803  ORF Transcript_11059/g.16803 Transcript_11059/m.16803 type:complete len:88 (-) Transcript_11059:212-475(-)
MRSPKVVQARDAATGFEVDISALSAVSSVCYLGLVVFSVVRAGAVAPITAEDPDASLVQELLVVVHNVSSFVFFLRLAGVHEYFLFF